MLASAPKNRVEFDVYKPFFAKQKIAEYKNLIDARGFIQVHGYEIKHEYTYPETHGDLATYTGTFTQGFVIVLGERIDVTDLSFHNKDRTTLFTEVTNAMTEAGFTPMMTPKDHGTFYIQKTLVAAHMKKTGGAKWKIQSGS